MTSSLLKNPILQNHTILNNEVGSKVFEQLKHGTVWTNPREDVDNYDGLLSILRARDSDFLIYVEATLKCLVSDDLFVRTGAVAVLEDIAGDIQEDFFVNLLQTNLKLFRGVKPAFRIAWPDLEQSAVFAVQRLLFTKANPKTLNYLKDIAQNTPWGSMVIDIIARFDSDWVLKHPTLVDKKNLYLFFTLPRDKRLALAKSLAPFPPEPTEPLWAVQIRESAWKKFTPEEAEELKAMMWPKG